MDEEPPSDWERRGLEERDRTARTARRRERKVKARATEKVWEEKRVKEVISIDKTSKLFAENSNAGESGAARLTVRKASRRLSVELLVVLETLIFAVEFYRGESFRLFSERDGEVGSVLVSWDGYICTGLLSSLQRNFIFHFY